MPGLGTPRRWLHAMSWHMSGKARFMLSFMNERTVASVYPPWLNSAMTRNTRLERLDYCSALSEQSSRMKIGFSSSLILSPCDQLGQLNDFGIHFIYLVREGLQIWGLEHARLFTNLQPACSLLRHWWGLSELNCHLWRCQISSFVCVIKCACKQTVRTLPS